MLEAKQLTKYFGRHCAVDDVSFTVKKGEVLGFLGPNAAGKSTTMRMITGFLPADSGFVKINGYTLNETPVKAKAMLGYLPENAPLYMDMTVIAFLRFIAALRGFSGKNKRDMVERVIATCFLEPVTYQSIDTLSKGYRHRVCFAQAILHDPLILVLDEPTDGLDPNQKHEMRNLIKRMGQEKAIILSTHILEEVDAVCDRIMIINRGRVVADGLPDDLRAQGKEAGSLLVSIVQKSVEEVNKALKTITEIDTIEVLNDMESGCRLRIIAKSMDNGSKILQEKVSRLIQQSGWGVSEFHRESGRLDAVFRQITSSDNGVST